MMPGCGKRNPVKLGNADQKRLNPGGTHEHTTCQDLKGRGLFRTSSIFFLCFNNLVDISYIETRSVGHQ